MYNYRFSHMMQTYARVQGMVCVHLRSLAMAASIQTTPSASDRMKATIMQVPSFPEYQVVSDRTAAVKEGCARVLQAISMPGDK